MERRLRNLLEVIAIYTIDRISLHSLVYLLENVQGIELGYKNCDWRLYATGPFCDKIEEDLQRLVMMELVSVENDGTLKARIEPPVRVKVNPINLIKQAYRHYIEKHGYKRSPIEGEPGL